VTSETLLTELGHLVKAPRGIERLRRLVVDLGVQGRLTSDVQPDAFWVTNGGPLPVPKAWKWTTLDAEAEYVQRGKGPKYADRGAVRVISQKCVRDGTFDLEPARYISDGSIDGYKPERFLRTNDVLWNSTGEGTVGRSCIFPGLPEGMKAVADSHVTVIRAGERLDASFLQLWLSGSWVQDQIVAGARGSTKQTELNLGTVKGVPVPLSPVEEQEHIVRRVHQLMTLCEEVEAALVDERRLAAELAESICASIA
jgi:type I restriction enzyme S subunit